MVGAAVFTYGLLMSFIFSGASRNARERRPNPPMLVYAGYVMCGLTGTIAVLLLGYAVAAAAGVRLA